MSFHKDEVGASLHNLHAFTYADASARTGAVGLVSGDIGKIAKQTDTNRYYILLNNSPVTWSEITAPSNGGGGINYISNPTGEDSAAGWAAYADAVKNIPADGTGGAPNVTLTRSTSSPLRGAANFLLTKDAANRQGQGASYDFTIDRADMAKMLEISFDFEPTTGFVAANGSTTPLFDNTTSTNAGNSDVEVFMYDVTNALLIPVIPAVITSGVAVQSTFIGNFQAAPNSSSYRLILHVATASATAYTLKFDNVRVGPPSLNSSDSTRVVAARIKNSAAQSFTSGVQTVLSLQTTDYDTHVGWSTGSNAYTVPVSGKYKMSFSLTWNGTGTFTSGSSRMRKNGSTFATQEFLPISSTMTQKSWGYSSEVDCSAGDTLDITITQTDTGAAARSLNNDANEVWACFERLPGPSNSEGDARVVAMLYSDATGTSLNTGASVTPTYNTKNFDTHNAFNGGTGIYTVPVSGKYQLSAHSTISTAGWDAGERFSITVQKNGADQFQMCRGTQVTTHSSGVETFGTMLLDLVAGDTLNIQLTQTSGATVSTSAAANQNWIYVHRLGGPSAVAPTETVAVKAQRSSAQSITSGAFAILAFDTTPFDTHGIHSAGSFTVPVSGFYSYNAVCNWTANATGSRQLSLFKNGSQVETQIMEGNGTIATSNSIGGSVQCVAGDVLTLQVFQSSGGSLNIVAGTNVNWASIFRIK